MTAVWLGHKIWAVITSELSQSCRGGTNTPCSLIWSYRSRSCTWKYLLKDHLPHANVKALPAPVLLPSNFHPSPAAKTTDVNSIDLSSLVCHHWHPYNPPAEKMQEEEEFFAGYILGRTSWVRNPGQFPQDVLMSPYGLKCSIMKWTAASQ